MLSKSERILEILEKNGIRPSYQRIQVLTYLLENDIHPTADMIFTGLQEKTPVISRATVYNTLNLFEDKGIVSTMSADRTDTRYDLLDRPHGHFVCDKCSKIFNFEYNYSEVYSGLEGFRIDNKEIVLKGLCKECKETNNKQ